MLLGPADAFDQRLSRRAAQPLALALSGGGDSLYLLLAAKAWADRAGRRLVALTVDHRLQGAGADWARWCARRCAALGVEHRTLAWDAPKPATGLAAVARAARHGLVAGAAREVGAAVILMGHTADDILEAQVMRTGGLPTPSPHAWAPSPVWPAGRGLFILRPLLGLRRAALRQALAALGETWIEDPANDDPASPRARARLALAAAPPPSPSPCRSWRLPIEVCADAGEIRLNRADLADAALVSVLATCASGVEHPPRRDRAEALARRLGGQDRATATLAGARFEAEGEAVGVTREAGEFRRRRTQPVALPPGATIVWDGRFEITAGGAGLAVQPLGGLAARLSPGEARALKAFGAAARRSLPAVVGPRGSVTCPILAQSPDATVRPLAPARLLALGGAIGDEAAIWRVAKAPGTS